MPIRPADDNAHMRLLVVDDDRALRDVLRRALTLAGYDVHVAETGAGALSDVSSIVPDAVVLDIGLPDIDGLEVCRLLRREGNRVPILMLTARDAVADRIDGLDAGADDYLVKPFDIDELKARLRALLRRAGGDVGTDGLTFARAGARSGPPRRHRRRAVRRADEDRVPAARAADPQPAARAAPQPHLRPRVGLRLRPDLERAARLHRLPAAQARGRRRAAADPHGSGRRLRAAGAEPREPRAPGWGSPPASPSRSP